MTMRLAGACAAAAVLWAGGCGSSSPLKRPVDGGGGTAATADGAAGGGDVRPGMSGQHCYPFEPLIDDMEGGLFFYAATPCPQGSWELATAGGGTSEPVGNSPVTPVAISDNGASTRAIHVAGSGQTNVIPGYPTAYVWLTATLNQPSLAANGDLNATDFQGIRFDYKLSVGATGARIQVGDVFSDPNGGLCSGAGSQSCYDDPGMALPASAGWRTIDVPFADLSRLGFGYPGGPVAKNRLYSVRWTILIPASGPVDAWDLWVDNLTLY